MFNDEFADEDLAENLYMEDKSGETLVIPKWDDDGRGARAKKVIISANGTVNTIYRKTTGAKA